MRKYILIGASLCLSLFSYAQKAVDFKLNPKVGKPLTTLLTIKTDVDGPQSVIMDMGMKMSLTATKHENNVFTMESVVKGIKMDVNTGVNTIHFNSEEEPADEMSKMLATQFSQVLGKTFSMNLSQKGKVIDFTLPEGLDEGMDSETFGNITTPLPDEAVAVGATWKNEVQMAEHPFLSRTETVSTFKAETPQGYVIDVLGKLYDTSDKQIGEIVGSYTLDKQSFLTKEGTVKTTIEVQGAKVISDVKIGVIED